MPKKAARFGLPEAVHLILAIFVAQLAGIIGAFFTTSEIPTWYASLAKPDFTPPSWLFGPVWIILYALMGTAQFLVCTYGKPAKKTTVASYWYYAQLALNVVWSVVFFGFHSLWGGLIVILLLWALILHTIRQFAAVQKTAALLLLPYLAWVTFATILTVFLVRLN